MDKYKEAIKAIKANYPPENYIMLREGLDLAIEALEKQIPKLAQETQELIEIEYICPECDHINGQRFNYCWNCGQSITHS